VGPIQKMMKDPPLRWLPVEKNVAGPIEDLPPSRWLRQECGIYYRAAARLNANKGWFDAVTLNFAAKREEVSPAKLMTASIFLPHLAKVVEVGRAFRILRARFHAVLEELDHFHTGVLILGALGRVVVKNREAERIISLQDGFGMDTHGRIAVTDPKTRPIFTRALNDAPATTQSASKSSGTILLIPRRSEQDPFVADVSPPPSSRAGIEPENAWSPRTRR